MISESRADYSEAYVWIWLPDATEPVVAGLLSKRGNQLVFNYGRRYLARRDAIALYAPELPLRAGRLPLLPGLSMPSCIRDASPDAWGRRVLINRTLGAHQAGYPELDELTYLLASGSDRIGALDFQASASRRRKWSAGAGSSTTGPSATRHASSFSTARRMPGRRSRTLVRHLLRPS